MNYAKQIANQFREVYLNGNWVSTNLKTQLSDVTWEQAQTKIGNLNTIADLAYHVNYYVDGIGRVLAGGPLDIRDKYSFDLPEINSEADWQQLLEKMWRDAERFADLVEAMPDERLMEGFVDEKYGNYHRNIHAMIEHSYYHLGQIVILKKLVVAQKPA